MKCNYSRGNDYLYDSKTFEQNSNLLELKQFWIAKKNPRFKSRINS